MKRNSIWILAGLMLCRLLGLMFFDAGVLAEPISTPQVANRSDLDIYADAPWRVQPDSTLIPVLLFIKDADEQNYALRDIEIRRGAQPIPMKDANGNNLTLEEIMSPIPRDEEIAGELYYLLSDGVWRAVVYLDASDIGDEVFTVNFTGRKRADTTWSSESVTTKALFVHIGEAPLPKFDNWYYGDTHFHSLYTDNILEYGLPVDSIDIARRYIGLDWVTITDHTHWGLDEQRWEDLGNVLSPSSYPCLLRAAEITPNYPITKSKGVHILYYAGDSYIHDDDTGGNLYDILERVQKANGFVYAAHPMDPNFRWENEHYNTALIPKFVDTFAGLEIWNTRAERESADQDNPFPWKTNLNTYAELDEGVDQWDELLMESLETTGIRKLFCSGGSDAHGDFNYHTSREWIGTIKANDNAFGKVRTVVYFDGTFSKEKVLTALRNGRSVMTDGPLVVFGLDENGDGINEKMIGDDATVMRDPNGKERLIIKGRSTSEFGETITLILRRGRQDNDSVEDIGELTIEDDQSYILRLQTNELFLDENKNGKTDIGEPGMSWGNQSVFPNPDNWSGWTYFRIEARTNLGYRCYTNPIWIKVASPAFATGIDVALILDRSGSMNTANKLPKAKEAARYFVEDTRAGDQIAISAFDDTGLLVAPLTLIDDPDPNSSVKQNLKTQINTLTPGNMTNFGAGLQIAYNELKKSTTAMPKTGVLMTNGQHNTGSYNTQVADFKSEGWPIYTVGFGSDVNETSLKQIADDTGGKYYYAETIDITAIYDLISARVHNESIIAAIAGFISQMQTIVTGGIWADPSMDWLRIAAFWGGSDIDLTLMQPDGQQIDPNYAAVDPNMEYYEDATYAYYIVQHPMPGEWKAQLFGADIPGDSERYNLNVRASTPIFSDFFPALKSEYDVGETVNIGVQLAEVTAEFTLEPISGASVTCQISRPNGPVESLTLLETTSGIYSGEYINTGVKGLYSVNVTATGTTASGQFTRKLQTTLQVGQPPFNNPPVAVAKVITEGCGLGVGLPIEFDGSGSYDPDGDPLAYKWSFGDGGTSTDMNPTHEYAASGTYNVTLLVNDGKVDSPSSALDVQIRPKPRLISASFIVLDPTLILDFNVPMMPDPIHFNDIGMEVGDSGNWDFAMSDTRGLHADETEPSSRLTIDIKRSWITSMSLSIAALVSHRKVDILFNEGAFVDECGNNVMPVVGTDNITIWMMTDGYVLGVLGDANGNAEVTAHDADIILKSTVVEERSTVIPIFGAASETAAWLGTQGYDFDILMDMLDVSRNGDISSYDAALTLQIALGRSLSAPSFSSGVRNGKLKVDSYHDQNLEVSIDLDNVTDVYSADIVLTYDPRELTVVDVFKTSSISGWLSEHGADSGKLRISLAGASQPASDGSLVTVSFRAASEDSIRKLDITELKLNDGLLNTYIENLPKVFAGLQNYPNPFNPETWIPYQLTVPANVTVSIYNLNGQIVRRLELGTRMPGSYVDRSKAAYWDGRNESGEMVSSGIYFYQLQADRDAAVRKMVIVK